MESVPLVVMLVGFGVAFLGWVAVLREMFYQEDRVLGYATFVVPVLALVYGFMHWDDCRQGTVLMLSGGAVVIAGAGLRIAFGA